MIRPFPETRKDKGFYAYVHYDNWTKQVSCEGKTRQEAYDKAIKYCNKNNIEFLMIFCPNCGNVLLIEHQQQSFRYFCKTCPYIFDAGNKIKHTNYLEHEDNDVVLGGNEAWADVSKTQAVCSKCDNTEAYWKEIQIRSADEPTTIFYKCTKCGYEWREG